ncbi:MAG: type II toxin-antitoxin system Phd/YefM family antitoxin [Burkholderiales bacterium]
MQTLRLQIREFKARLSHYLGRARAGQAIEITSHRKVIARVTGVPPTETEGIARLVASGAAQWGGGKPSGAEIRLTNSGPRVSELVLQDRE